MEFHSSMIYSVSIFLDSQAVASYQSMFTAAAMRMATITTIAADAIVNAIGATPTHSQSKSVYRLLQS